jgi:hypothetical protein
MSDLRSAADLAILRAGALPFKSINGGVTYGFNNTLIEAATPSPDRQQTNYVDYDIHRTISVQGRRLLLSMARILFWKFPALQASILEQANLAVHTFTPRFAGKNKGWGDEATSWLQGWHRIFDLAGAPYDEEVYRELLIISWIVDGEMGTLLTEDASGNPRIQIIPSHRIGSRYQTGGSVRVRYEPNGRDGKDGSDGGSSLYIDGVLVDPALPWTFAAAVEWDAPIIDGVIVDDQARPIAYRVYDDPVVSGTYRDISARNMFLSYLPMFPGQLRGISLLASSVFPMEDVHESRAFEMLAQKTFSSRTIVEENESGDIDPSKQLVMGAQYAPVQLGADGQPLKDANGNALPQQKLSTDTVKAQGGTYTIFKARSGSRLTAFDWSRPSRNAQEFQETMLRDAFRWTEWDMFFSLDPKSVGGAPMRVIVDKINRVLKKRRRLPSKALLRADCYGLAKGAMRSGELAFDPEWYKWHYQGPPDITADRRYEAQTDLMEFEAGWSNMQDTEAKRNGDWQAKREQREREVEDKFTRAKKIADKFGVSIQEVLLEFGKIGTATFTYKEQEDDPPQPQEDKGGEKPEPAKGPQSTKGSVIRKQ